MSGDRYYSNVTLLIEGSGANNGTTIVDTSMTPKTISKFGNVKTSTAVNNPFGANNGVMAFDGSGDYLSTPTSTDFNFGAGDFTVEAWIYRKTATDYATLLGNWTGSTGFFIVIDPDGKIRFAISIDGVNQITAINAGSVALNIWVHIAVFRSGSTIKASIAGTVIGTYTIGTNAIYASSGAMFIGMLYGTSYPLDGYLFDVRDTKGVARYTADFTPPSAIFPNYSGQISYTLAESLAATQFRLIASKISDGTLVKTAVITASGSMNMTLLDAVSLAAIPVQGNKWQAGIAYAAGDLVFPAASYTHYFKRVTGTGGTSGSTEPAWVNIIGDTTTDDGVWNNCWECIALLADSITHSPIVPSDTSPPTVTFDFTPTTPSTTTHLHRAWSPDNSAFVFWTDTVINLSPTVTIPTSVVANLVNKCVVM
jgi:hypothetical protein